MCPKIGYGLKNHHKWVFIKYGRVIYHRKAHGKEIPKRLKKFDLPHPPPTPPKRNYKIKIGWSPIRIFSDQQCLVASCTSNTED